MITEFAESASDRLARVWPAVADALMRQLGRRGTPTSQAEDIVQEVATRVLVAEPEFTNADELLRWASTVARRVSINARRSEAHYDPMPFDEHRTEDLVAASTVEDRVVNRLLAQRVLAAVGQLSPEEREAISGSGSTASDRRAQIRLAVQRHRARAHLARIVGGLGAAALGWLRWLRGRRAVPVTVALIGVVALSVVLALGPRHGGGPTIGVQAVPRAAPGAAATTLPLARRGAPEPPSPRVVPRNEGPDRLSTRQVLSPPISTWNTGYLAVDDRKASEPVLCVYELPGLPTLCTP